MIAATTTNYNYSLTGTTTYLPTYQPTHLPTTLKTIAADHYPLPLTTYYHYYILPLYTLKVQVYLKVYIKVYTTTTYYH